MRNFILIICLFCSFLPLHANEESVPSLNIISRLAKDGNFQNALNAVTVYIAKHPNETRAIKLRGHIFFAQNRYPEALADFSRVIELVPNSANAYVDRAGVYYAIGDLDNALVDVNTALEIKPNSSFALILKDSILDKQNPPKNPSFKFRKGGVLKK